MWSNGTRRSHCARWWCALSTDPCHWRLSAVWRHECHCSALRHSINFGSLVWPQWFKFEFLTGWYVCFSTSFIFDWKTLPKQNCNCISLQPLCVCVCVLCGGMEAVAFVFPWISCLIFKVIHLCTNNLDRMPSFCILQATKRWNISQMSIPSLSRGQHLCILKGCAEAVWHEIEWKDFRWQFM